MDSPGLGWLAESGWPAGCLVFVRGVSEDQILRAFGANPGEAVPRAPGEPVPVPEGMTDSAPVIRVGRAGDWAIVVDGEIPPQGIRPEVLRRVTANGGEARWDNQGWREPLSWRPRFIADFRDVEVPAAELRAAEEAWLADPEPVRGRWGGISPEPVRAHVAALIAAGMEPERIVELAGGMTTVFIDNLLSGVIRDVRISDARNLLLIRA